MTIGSLLAFAVGVALKLPATVEVAGIELGTIGVILLILVILGASRLASTASSSSSSSSGLAAEALSASTQLRRRLEIAGLDELADVTPS